MGSLAKGLFLVLILIVATSTLSLLVTRPASAQTRTIVVPDNYSTIGAAVENATNGDIILVRKGNYQEHTIVINKTLTIIGEDKSNTKITNTDNHVWNQATQMLPPVTYAINITTNNVRISQFTISEASTAVSAIGTGIVLTGLSIPSGEVILNGSNQTFAYNSMTAFYTNVHCVGSGNFLGHNDIIGGVYRGIIVQGSQNTIIDNKITSFNIRYLNGTNTNLVANSLLIRGDYNFVGGNSLKDSTLETNGNSNTVCGNILENGQLVVVGSSNTFYGNSLSPKSITDNSLSIPGGTTAKANQEAVTGVSIANEVQDSEYNLFYQNNFIGNGYKSNFTGDDIFPVLIWSGVKGTEYFDNGKVGNYWSNYNGTDSNGDGIGDTPFFINASNPQDINSHFVLTDNYPLLSPIDASVISLQLPSWANTAISQPLTASFPPQVVSNSTVTNPSTTPITPEFPAMIATLFLFAVTLAFALVVRRRKVLSNI